MSGWDLRWRPTSAGNIVSGRGLGCGGRRISKKMPGQDGTLSRQGRTIIFVSHQLSAIKNLCPKVMQLDNGGIVGIGEGKKIIEGYLGTIDTGLTSERIWENGQESGNDQFRLIRMRVLGKECQTRESYPTSEPIVVELEFDLMVNHSALCVGILLTKGEESIVFQSHHNDGCEETWPHLRKGRNKLRCTIPEGLLNEGKYHVAPKIFLQGIGWIVNGQAEVGFQTDLDHFKSPLWTTVLSGKCPGTIAPALSWQNFSPVE